MKDAIKKLSVGTLKQAENASFMCRAGNIQKAFLQGFRFARNNLQKSKGKLLREIK